MEAQCLVQLPSSSKFIWMIKNFSKLKGNEDGEIHSDDILVGGCKWYLSISPNDADHLALYLYCNEDDSATLMPYAKFKLAIVNQNHSHNTVRKDLDFQYSEDNGNGFPEFMHISKFNNPDEGYLLNDTCIIELEIAAACTRVAMKSRRNDKLLPTFTMDSLIIELPQSSKVIWIVKDFPKLNVGKETCSDTFSVGGCKWHLSILSNWVLDGIPYVSLYLTCHEDDLVAFSPYAQFSLAIVNQFISDDTVRRDLEFKFSANESCQGFSCFMPLNELENPDKGYLGNDTCIVELEIAAASTTRVMKHSADKDNLEIVKVVSDNNMQTEAELNAGVAFQAPRQHSDGVVFDNEKYIDIGGFSVHKAHASLYKQIWLKYGHIASSQVQSSITYNAQVCFVSDIMNFIADMHQCRLVEVSAEMLGLWEKKLKMAENLEFNVKCLRERFEDVKRRVHNFRVELLECCQSLWAAKAKVKVAENELEKSQTELAAAMHELRVKFSGSFSEADIKKYIEEGENLLFEGML